MSLNPLAPVTNYETKLSRIFWFTSLAAVGAIWLLRANVQPLDAAFGKVDSLLGEGESLPLPAGYLLPALVVGLISRVFQVHDRLSDLLGIRERFDVDVIITELADLSGFGTEGVSYEQVVRHRRQIMGKAFYEFTSTKNPQIDEHLIHQALDWWSWFWVVLETAFVFVLTGLTLIAYGVYPLGTATMFGALACAALFLPMLWSQCRRYAVAQVAAIMSESARVNYVWEILRNTFGHANTQIPAWHVKEPAQSPSLLEDRWERHLRR